jgi:glycosyltransferase involved in cell wall biosynthesis
VLVVPFHNEQHHLPRLIESLRNQEAPRVPVVFVDNASADGSRTLVEGCDEVRRDAWLVIGEPRVGKFHAMRSAAAFCRERFAAPYVGFVDADSYFADAQWLATCLDIVSHGSGPLGYTYSPFRYFGCEHLVNFQGAYRAYQSVLVSLMEHVGWLANGQAFVCAADLLGAYFERAPVTTEMDLRLSLLALSQRRRAEWLPALVMTSARRITVSPQSFAAWCFYDHAFYAAKDINAATKVDLRAPATAHDLEPAQIGHCFRRRAVKLVCRNLIPLLVFDRSALFLERLGARYGPEIATQVARAFRSLGRQDVLASPTQFEAMVSAIEAHPASTDLCRSIEQEMCTAYRRAPAVAPSPVGAERRPLS